MRDSFKDKILELVKKDPKVVFLTADLGYKALEQIQAALGERFINVGVAEQNMIGVAAGLAKAGLKPWAYSIAPFAVLRPLEQIRNDVCLHNLPVTIVGNGGGFGYGVMGPTHHSLEDYGILSSLPNMQCYIPAFNEDISPIVDKIIERNRPAYLRLGLDRTPKNESKNLTYKPLRILKKGSSNGPVIIFIGPIIGLFSKWVEEYSPNASIWLFSEFPIDRLDLSKTFLSQIKDAIGVIIIEEHVSQSGLGADLTKTLAEMGYLPKTIKFLSVKRERESFYGDQIQLLEKNGLGKKNLLTALRQIKG